MRIKIFVLASVWLFAWPSLAKEVAWSQLQENCLKQFQSLPDLKWDGGEFFPTKDLVATQPRFAFFKMKRSLENHLEKHDAEWDHVTRKYVFKENGGQSLYPEKARIKGVVYRGKFYIVDGHHRALVSTYTGSPTVPVDVIKKIDSNVSWAKFLEYMEEENLVYSYTRDGQPKFYNLCEMKDDPNLYLARLISLRVTINPKTEKLQEVDGIAESPLVLKINRGRTRQEYDIARIAKRLGIFYRPAWGKIVPKTVLNRLAAGLRAEGWDKDGRVILLDGSLTREELDIERTVKAHLKAYDCEKILQEVN